MKTERMTFVMTPEDKAEIARRAAELHIPASELIRRAVAGYDPDYDEEVLLRLAEELEASAAETEKMLDETLAAVGRTTARLKAQRTTEAA